MSINEKPLHGERHIEAAKKAGIPKSIIGKPFSKFSGNISEDWKRVMRGDDPCPEGNSDMSSVFFGSHSLAAAHSAMYIRLRSVNYGYCYSFWQISDLIEHDYEKFQELYRCPALLVTELPFEEYGWEKSFTHRKPLYMIESMLMSRKREGLTTFLHTEGDGLTTYGLCWWRPAFLEFLSTGFIEAN